METQSLTAKPPTPRSIPQFTLVLFVFTLFALALRLPGIFNDFSIDEIWSLNHARQAGSLVGVFTDIDHDNNHWLNTLFLVLLGDQPAWWRYRLLSLITGTAMVPLLGAIARKQLGMATAVIGMSLLAVSYFFVHYSSEARGYAPAGCFALLSFLLMQHWRDALSSRSRWTFAAFFWIAVALGFMAHQSFIFAYAGLVLGSTCAWHQSPRRPVVVLIQLTILHVVPMAFGAWLYFIDIRGQEVGAASKQTMTQALIDVTAWTCGTPRRPTPAIVIAIAATILSFIALVALQRRRNLIWVTLVAIALLAPIALLLSPLRPQLSVARLFFIPAIFAMFCIAIALGWMWQTKRVVARVLVVVAMIAFYWGNGLQLARFYRDGRGQYLAALSYIADHSATPTIAVTGDNAWRTKLMLDFYQRYLPTGKRIKYVERERWPTEPPMWVLRQTSFEEPREVRQDFRIGSTVQFFALVRTFPYHGPTGWNWHLYEYQPTR